MALSRELLGHPLGLLKGGDLMASHLAGPQIVGFRLWRQSGRPGAAAWCARAELARREKVDGQGSSSANSPTNRTPTTQAAIAGRVMDATTSNAPDEEELEDVEGPLGSSLELGDDPPWAPSTSGALWALSSAPPGHPSFGAQSCRGSARALPPQLNWGVLRVLRVGLHFP